MKTKPVFKVVFRARGTAVMHVYADSKEAAEVLAGEALGESTHHWVLTRDPTEVTQLRRVLAAARAEAEKNIPVDEEMSRSGGRR